MAAVGRCCGGTLTELAITMEGLTASIVMGVTSTQEFKNVRHLELHMLIFTGPWLESGKWQSHLDRLEKIRWDIEQILRLTVILPPPIQTLTSVGLREDDRRLAIRGRLSRTPTSKDLQYRPR